MPTKLEPNMTLTYLGESGRRVLRPGDAFYVSGTLFTFLGIEGEQLHLRDRVGEFVKEIKPRV